MYLSGTWFFRGMCLYGMRESGARRGSHGQPCERMPPCVITAHLPWEQEINDLLMPGLTWPGTVGSTNELLSPSCHQSQAFEKRRVSPPSLAALWADAEGPGARATDVTRTAVFHPEAQIWNSYAAFFPLRRDSHWHGPRGRGAGSAKAPRPCPDAPPSTQTV